jgi:bifunctional UDP-N-acetylglucosamine pyrophosphorylase/glucosamine-1-phosphate N-acetyltransferase
MSAQTHVVILAAGQGTRMKSGLPKVLHPIAGRPMIERVLDTARAADPASISLIVGHGADAVRQRLAAWPGLQFAEQSPQLGTAHALQQAEPLLAGRSGTVVLLSGDVPLLRPDTLRQLLAVHERAGAAATVMTAIVERPYGYGRIVRTGGALARIVEERDATPAERQIREIDAGSAARAVSRTRSIIGRPAMGCSTFGSADFIRVPWPAASMTTCVCALIER